MSLINVVPYVLWVTPGVLGAPEPKMYPCSGYFLVMKILINFVTYRTRFASSQSKKFSNFTIIFSGGMSLTDDMVKAKKCHIAVGTPGRIK